jgi:propanol-preferring alcohol dehydrogenase
MMEGPVKAYVIRQIGPLAGNPAPLSFEERPVPVPGPGEVRLRVLTCGVCHTELDELEGRTPPTRFPRIPGHQVVGIVDAVGSGVPLERLGQRMGVAWIARTCGECSYCRSGRENLCPYFEATGRDLDGGYAEFMTAPASALHAIPPVFDDAHAAPLLCAGAVGFRALRLTGLTNGQSLGLTGFGASGHLTLQLARALLPRTPVFVFARSENARAFARDLGAEWAGDTAEPPPEQLDAIIDTTPAWTPVLHALDALAPGGRLVINAIRKEAADRNVLQQLDYVNHLWREKSIQSVANVTRADVRDCLRTAAAVPVAPTITAYPFREANRALIELGTTESRGARVLTVAGIDGH